MNTIAKADQPGLTKVRNLIQTLVLIAVSITTVWMLYMVPSWQPPGDPFLLAAVAGAITVVCLWLTRWLGSRAMRFERAMLSAFLVGMPLVYVMGWFAARDHTASSWIWVELLGLALFAAFAALGLKSSPWFLARNRRPWSRMGFLALPELGLYPGLVCSCLPAPGLSARRLCGRACPRLQRGVADSEKELRRSRAHHSCVFMLAYWDLICGLLTNCRQLGS
jgi:hypothetical protein